jgi:hypothetical protein
MGMSATRFVELQTGSARKPYGGNASVVKGSSKFVKTGDALPMQGNQTIDGDVKNIRCLTQAGSEKSF